jgi:exocyst complex component 2
MNVDAILAHYKLDNPFPSEWPTDKDFDDSDDEEGLVPEANSKKGGALKSRYSVLEKNPKRTSVPGAEKTKDGVDNLVQRDEPDPLGKEPSVIQTLRRKGIQVDNDGKLRNRYLLSSTTFSPNLFLSEVHSDATTEELMEGLSFLSQSIEQKSASLKVLVESNFEKFVRAKTTIDNVYREMVSPGQDSDAAPPPTARKPHSRQASRQSLHFRKSSAPFSPNAGGFDKRKNALVKEQEYGILPIKVPLLELKAKVDEVWGPFMGGREREDHLKVLMASTEKQRNVFDIGSNIAESIRRRDYDMLIEEYLKAKNLAEDARLLLQSAEQTNASLSDADILQIVSTARMWSDIEDQIETFKRDVWRKLAGTHFTSKAAHEDGQQEQYMELIKILLELGVEDNPISVWLFSRYDYLKQRIVGTFERSKVEIEILRRRLSYGEKPSLSGLATHLKSVNADGRIKPDGSLDSHKIIELWDHMFNCLTAMLSTDGGVLGEVIDFWETAQSFINGNAQQNLPSGIDGNSRKHHRLSTDGVKALDGGAEELISLIRDSIQSFFTDAPIEDLSMLLSPLSAPPMSPMSPRTPKSANIPTFGEAHLRVDMTNIPPPSPRKGEAWERYAFWPPYANSVSGVHYLSQILGLVASSFGELANLSLKDNQRATAESFKVLVSSVRERCLQAACAAWSEDCENSRVLEDWTRETERPDLTNLPSRLMNYEGFILVNLQKILYISDIPKSSGVPDIVVPPSNKLLQVVRSQFVGGLYKIINGMKEHAEASSKISEIESDGLTTPARDPAFVNVASSSVDASNKVWYFKTPSYMTLAANK